LCFDQPAKGDDAYESREIKRAFSKPIFENHSQETVLGKSSATIIMGVS
jgi:hypothetical protein